MTLAYKGFVGAELMANSDGIQNICHCELRLSLYSGIEVDECNRFPLQNWYYIVVSLIGRVWSTAGYGAFKVSLLCCIRHLLVTTFLK
jgi:hypothetical protein